MKKLLYLIAVVFVAGTTCAEVIEIPQGGYSIDADSTAKAFYPEGYKTLPNNIIFPRVRSKSFYLDSVIWKSADEKDNLNSVLSRHTKETNISISNVHAFVTSSGIKALRFELHLHEPSKRHLVHRLIFRNSENRIICVGIYGASDVADNIFSSIKLLQ